MSLSFLLPMNDSISETDAYINWLPSSILQQHELPFRFTFPFYYRPHPLSIYAAEEVMSLLERSNFQHNFGLDPNKKGLVIGKMFGILLIKSQNGKIGYLKAFSGKLANSNIHEGFVPPIFDMLQSNGFYIQGEKELIQLNHAIVALEESERYKELQRKLSEVEVEKTNDIQNFRTLMAKNKADRKRQREEAILHLSTTEYEQLQAQLIQQSHYDQYLLKQKRVFWQLQIDETEKKLEEELEKINELKEQRKQKSNALQQRLFSQYNFLNKSGERKNVKEIFENILSGNPPSGAGECATPKLLQYAFLHELEPLAMAEFWWGASPISEIRKHRQFYPACRGKCEPILQHMLKGIELDPNPMQEVRAIESDLEILLEDEHIIVINKPTEMLSVPGKTPQISVLDILKKRYPFATGPLLVHRLDMSTSGILLAAKTKEAHQNLQAQFIKKTVLKKYTALLEGLLKMDSGEINLPLRVDLENRPHQLVCFEYGKPAKTLWKKLKEVNHKTRVEMIPVTGRTHQLRVHAAHSLGLNMPIFGDDLYGHIANRLHLHANSLTFKHPITKQITTIECPAPF